MELERNVRSFGRIIWLSIITFGIYSWVYLFKTLNEMENAFTFTPQEIAPRKVRTILVVYLIVTIVLCIIWIGVKTFLGGLDYSSTSSDFKSLWEIISSIISVVLTVVFLVSFVRLIEACQVKRGIVPLSKEIIWILLTVIVSLFFAPIIGAKALSLLNLPVYLVFLYLIVKQINRIWKGV